MTRITINVPPQDWYLKMGVRLGWASWMAALIVTIATVGGYSHTHSAVVGTAAFMVAFGLLSGFALTIAGVGPVDAIGGGES